MDFEILDALLKKKHMSRRALALAVGIKESTMSTAFMRRSGLSSEDVIKIAEYLGVSPYYLEGWTEDEKQGRLSPGQEDQVVKAGNLIRYRDYKFGSTFAQDDNDQANGREDIQQNRQRLNTAFDRLNQTGQHEAVKRVEELTEIPRYTTPEDHQEG